jgi:3-oxoacyl-[acyl-carrier protein] reductase
VTSERVTLLRHQKPWLDEEHMAETRPLANQVALVTGAGRGLGRAFAERLAALGCAVGVHGMREEGPAEFGEGTSLSDTARSIGEDFDVRTCRVLADLTHADQVERIVAEVEADLGPIDILVHNAGGDVAAQGGKPDPNDAVLIKAEDVRAVLDRNLLSTVLVCQQVARGMMARKRGRILTISSIAAFQARAHGVIYATAKAGVVHYTQCLAKQLRPFDVTVNTLAPGDTRTARYLATREVDPARLVEEGTLERIATVDEVARVVELFAGPMGAFVSGQVLRVDGGAS